MKRTLNLTVSFDADDEGAATRKVRSLLKWLGRTWRLKVLSINWTDQADKPKQTDPPPPYRG